jgi:murein DD-endopeptidase MepM/ murein hydrolase activator NlpD
MKQISLFLLITLFSFSLHNSFAQIENEFTVSINGTIEKRGGEQHRITSPNSLFGCNYKIGAVTDEQRGLNSFEFYGKGNLLFTLPETPGSDIEISNSGFIVFYDHSEHYKGKLRLHFYNSYGKLVLLHETESASLFGFSKEGNKFGVRNPEVLNVINLTTAEVTEYEKCYRFEIIENPNRVLLSVHDELQLYEGEELLIKIISGIDFPRKVALSNDGSLIGVIDKRNLKVFSTGDKSIVFSDKLSGEFSFRDLSFHNGKLIAGIHKKNDTESSGLLRIYDLFEKRYNDYPGERRELKKPAPFKPEMKEGRVIEPIPWPFVPFDSTHKVWNYHEQHMGWGNNSSYLHQGLDIIIPVNEPTYAVKPGIVKCVLTLGGAAYWRIAVADSQFSGRSNGWLYAHLVQNTIQFDVGDTVLIHDYLGNIIIWSEDWGHIHFVEINDVGLVWKYDDGEWGINFNPLLALTPVQDTIPPRIEKVFPNSKFALCRNESNQYLSPDSLTGEIDIIVKVVDYIGNSDWQQPAYKTFYWIKRISDGEIIQQRKMGHILNHSYDQYNSNYYTPYAKVIYQLDETLTATTWMSKERNFFHSLTNSNGDSVVTLNEKVLGFKTQNYPDGLYRIFIEVFDLNGNSTLDSLDVYFKNGIVGINDFEGSIPEEFVLFQNYPNPFNPVTTIKFSVPAFTSSLSLGERVSEGRVRVTLKIYDVLGREVATLVDEMKAPGTFEFLWDATGLSSGVYFYKLFAESFGQAGSFIQLRKMILLR